MEYWLRLLWCFVLQALVATLDLPAALASPTFLSGVRDLAYDAARQLVFTAAIGGYVSIIDVSDATAPKLLADLAPTSIGDAHGVAYDAVGQRVFVASVSQSSVTCIDVHDPSNPAVVSTLTDETALYYSTHLAWDESRSALFVASAGSGDESNASTARRGHSISSVAVGNTSGCAMTLQHRMTSWSPEPLHIPGVNATRAYPVYTLLDPDRRLLYVSNDARCTVEVIDVRTLVPRKVGNYSSCRAIEYNSQSAYDRVTQRLFTVAQKAASFAVLDMTDPTLPKLESLLQDRNRTNTSQPLAGATGVALDARRRLAFVAAEHDADLVVVDVANFSAPTMVGRVQHPALAGEAVVYDAERLLAFVVSRRAAALTVVDVADKEAPAVVGVLSSKGVGVSSS
jgi:hypothetical protein